MTHDTEPNNKPYDIGMACVLVYQNYGSAFTNFALYNLLCDSGKSVLLINQPLCSEIRPDGPQNFDVWQYPSYSRKEFCKDSSELSQQGRLCKKIIVGSDQLFNYEIYKRIDGFTKLSWVDDDTDKVSYATSFGINEILGDEYERADFKRCIRRFRHISVRERGAVELIKRNFNISSTCVLDPVFMCNTEHYMRLISSVPEQPNTTGLFCYILDPEREKENIIKRVSNDLKLPVTVLSDMWRSADNIASLWQMESLTGLSNEQWLAKLYNSEYVITDSFHCLCFALIFNKPFIAVYNRLRGSERQLSLLETVGLEYRLITEGADEGLINELVRTSVNWESVNSILEREREYSSHWFENNVLK